MLPRGSPSNCTWPQWNAEQVLFRAAQPRHGAPGLPSLLGEMSVLTISQHSAQISPRGKKRLCPSVPSSNRGHRINGLQVPATRISFQVPPEPMIWPSEATISPFLTCNMGTVIYLPQRVRVNMTDITVCQVLRVVSETMKCCVTTCYCYHPII